MWNVLRDHALCHRQFFVFNEAHLMRIVVVTRRMEIPRAERRLALTNTFPDPWALLFTVISFL